jgi:hypothetical protein
MGGHDHHGPVYPPDGLLREPFQKPGPTEYALSRANRIVLMDELTDVLKDETAWKMENSMIEMLLLTGVWLSELTILILLSLSYR